MRTSDLRGAGLGAPPAGFLSGCGGDAMPVPSSQSGPPPCAGPRSGRLGVHARSCSDTQIFALVGGSVTLAGHPASSSPFLRL